MNITHSTISKMLITGAPSLDPITVYAEDIAPRQGKIVIECYGKSWSAYWGNMGTETLVQFFCSASADYIAGCLDCGIAASIFDPDGVKKHVKATICKERRSHELSADLARGLFDDIDSENIGDDPWQNVDILAKVYGSEWWYNLPEKANPDYVYLCRIITAVQAAFRSEMVPA